MIIKEVDMKNGSWDRLLNALEQPDCSGCGLIITEAPFCSHCGEPNPRFSAIGYEQTIGIPLIEMLKRCKDDHRELIASFSPEEYKQARVECPYCPDCGARVFNEGVTH